jgi:endo-1,3-1,4-beta-glycanase ExoK
MDPRHRPDPGRLSRSARIPAWQVAALAFGALVILGLAVVLAIGQPTADDQRAIAAREHPSQQTPEAIATLPEPGPVADPEAGIAPAPAAAAIPGGPRPMGQAFIDRFDRADITDRWFLSDGWSNGPWMANDWRSSEVEVTTDGVTLHLRKGPEGSEFEYAGGEIRTHDFFRYGYFEARMRVPRGAGVITGMFTYADRTESVKPNEIDIEILGRAPKVAELTIHENGKATSKKYTMPFDSSDGFHTYGFDWQPEHIRWYVDGMLVHEETGAAAQRVVRPQQLLFSVWGSKKLGAWAGELRPSEAPWRLDIACVAYAPAFTAPLCG